MVLPRKIDSPGTPILRIVVLRGSQNPVKGAFQKDQEDRPQLRLGPIVIRFSTCHAYPTKNPKLPKKANHEGGASFVFDPTNRPSSLLKRPFQAHLRGVHSDLRGKNERRATFVIVVFRVFRFLVGWVSDVENRLTIGPRRD